MKSVPQWLLGLDEEDIQFAKNFILASGSLKKIAEIYDVSYPTVRLRLDKLIQKIQMVEDASAEPFTVFVRDLALRDKIDLETAKLLIAKHKELKGESQG
ncbi:DUF2089 family protein [Alicyclobacillus sp. ALC3]|uniref:DUF2089 family protein n=1 Tax=Alicyclobacillus sp. ALC3 TaxID=2796143 RepID=UPI002379EBD3|nr:DUF2089 family protein [Alicyclobacillus sp. ALC3]WDL98449.1 DUF2089 family protein [Alicyclobacillus sp. ALC3]